MSDPIGEHNIHEYLTAFADGELDAADNLAILDYVSQNPDMVRLMRDQQRLRLTALRAVRGSTPPVPAALRAQIESMAVATLAADRARPAQTEARRNRAHRFLGVAAAVAASLLVGLVAGGLAARLLRSSPQLAPPAIAQLPTPVAPAEVVPVGLVTAATRVHVDCSRLADRLHSVGYPPQFTDLAASVRQDLGREDTPYPDLSSIGYRLVGAGPCGKPLEGTVHLLYKSPRPESVISLFVQAHTGRFAMSPGTLYTLSGTEAPFPAYAWRTERVVYFLVADNEEAADRARAANGTAPKT